MGDGPTQLTRFPQTRVLSSSCPNGAPHGEISGRPCSCVRRAPQATAKPRTVGRVSAAANSPARRVAREFVPNKGGCFILYLNGRKFRYAPKTCSQSVRVQVVYALLYAYFTSGAGRDARTHTLFLAELREFIRDTKPFSLHLRNSYGTRRNILKKEEDAKRFRKISLSSGQVILSVEAASSPSAPCPILMDKSSLGARSQWRSGGVEVDGWGRGGGHLTGRVADHMESSRAARWGGGRCVSE